MLIVSNHVSILDVPLILYALPFGMRHRIAIAMSGELLGELRWGQKPPILGRLLGPAAYLLTTMLFNVFPLPRLQGFRESFVHAGDALDGNYSVIIFPEGTRSTTGQIGTFRGGTGLLAMQAEVAVLPVALVGLEQINSGKAPWFRPGVLQVNVGVPIAWTANRSAPDWTSLLERAVRQLHN
jgi:long-chain acyl-CoA synthetase